MWLNLLQKYETETGNELREQLGDKDFFILKELYKENKKEMVLCEIDKLIGHYWNGLEETMEEYLKEDNLSDHVSFMEMKRKCDLMFNFEVCKNHYKELQKVKQ